MRVPPVIALPVQVHVGQGISPGIVHTIHREVAGHALVSVVVFNSVGGTRLELMPYYDDGARARSSQGPIYCMPLNPSSD